MRRSRTNYPVGATWEFANERGETAQIWLEERTEHLEQWRYHTNAYTPFPDDWGTSREMVRKMCPIYSRYPIRFKRTK